ncbi:MAG: cbb3-type cytochrome c oxidase subunit 3 [Halothiobacillaceae bacterium]|nr:cbb3-type cytochrome c oxidase subunit 3 [Halothiobacillaceae bacterium]MDY0049603.1 cbb3-type cytochrome c oxidase subunit 3 [Halothiobacillaceae bacterium]
MITDVFAWLGDLGNSKQLSLVIFFVTFVAIVLYVFTGKKRKERLESYKNIPFLDDDEGRPVSKDNQGNKNP